MRIEDIALSLRGDGRPRDLRSRLAATAVVLMLVFAALLARLWILQVVDGETYAELALQNHLKQREIPAPRGAIYDAHGQRIAEVRASFDLMVAPDDVDRAAQAPEQVAGALGGPPETPWELEPRTDIATLAARLAPLLDGGDPDALVSAFEESRKASRWRPALLRADLTGAELERVLANRPWLPGVAVVSRHRRSYPQGGLFAHLIGYMREVRGEDLERLQRRDEGTDRAGWYSPGDLIGKFGLEAAHERWLRGRNGAYWVQVDALGRELGRSAGGLPGDDYFESIAHFLDRDVVPEVAGHDLHLTVRQDLQARAVELLGDQSGAVVMMEAQTGRVLVLANAPVFDPELFSRPIDTATCAALRDDPAHPMVDKALQGVYPPGSTWKMLVAAAALGSGTWNEETRVSCPGYLKVGRRRFHCWNRRGHGSVRLKEALKGSCDVYFYKAGLAAGIDTVAEYAAMFGMGEPTGVGINGEGGALNPSTAWKARRYKGNPRQAVWTAGDTASAVIGQGYTLATPIQLARMTAVLANGGTLHRPLLVDRVVGPDGQVVMRGEPQIMGEVDLSPQHFQAIREGMFAVVDEVGGTARRQRLKELAFAGKTGTAQVVRLGASNAQRHKDHAWFVAFAPYDNPEVAVSVLVENGEHGSTAAAPIARELFELYFKDRIEEARAAGTRIGVPPAASARSALAEAPSPTAGLDAVPGLLPEELR